MIKVKNFFNIKWLIVAVTFAAGVLVFSRLFPPIPAYSQLNGEFG